MSLKILSVNCNGLKTESRRKEVFGYLKQMHYDIYCLQETYLVTELEETVKGEWDGSWFFDNFTNRSRGVAILFSKAVTVGEQKSNNLKEDDNLRGRCLMIKFCAEKKWYLLCCIYAPSGRFYLRLF